MKRAIVMFLVVSLCSIPMFATEQVAKARCISLEHVSGGWLMKIECVEGSGSIVLSDSGAYQGGGVFATWSQQKLGSTYQSLVPRDDSRVELLQLG